MTWLVVAPQPFFTPRGTPLSVYYRTLVVAEQGVKIDLLTYGPGQDVDIPGVRVIRIPRLRALEPVPVGPSWQKLLLDLFLILWTIGLLTRHRYRVVHAHEEAVFWCRVLKPLFGFRLIYDMHSCLSQQLESFRFSSSRLLIGAFQALERSSLRAANVVITICPDLRDQVMKLGVDAERHLLIENSVFGDVRLRAPAGGSCATADCVSVPFERGHPLILYAGTFEPYQGVEVLVEAFARVRTERPDARLLLVGGSDPQIRSLRALADSLGLGDTVLLTGRVAKSTVALYTQAASVLVSPRLHGSNTPLKIYEQIASGRTLVATRVRSHTQVLDETVCCLVDPDPAALAGGLLEVLNDPRRAEALARNASSYYQREYSRPIYEGKVRRLLDLVR
jgi:glycosyltransferase involved in cell wall biosynthesis